MPPRADRQGEIPLAEAVCVPSNLARDGIQSRSIADHYAARGRPNTQNRWTVSRAAVSDEGAAEVSPTEPTRISCSRQRTERHRRLQYLRHTAGILRRQIDLARTR